MHELGDGFAATMTDVSVNFSKVRALESITLTIKKGSIYGILGPNGSGKSTLMRVLCGLQRASSGDTFVFGCNVLKEIDRVRRHIGLVPQKFTLYPDLSVRENLQFMARIHGLQRRERNSRIEQLLQEFSLREFSARPAGQLSGGWQKRLSTAAALLHRPALLVLDEPTSEMDPVARRETWMQLLSLAREGITIIVSTHYIDEATRCTELAYLRKSKLLVTGAVSSLLKIPELNQPDKRRVEVEFGSNIARAMEGIEELKSLEQVSFIGSKMRFVANKSVPDDDLVKAMRVHCVEPISLRDVEPNLEEVLFFLSHEEKK